MRKRSDKPELGEFNGSDGGGFDGFNEDLVWILEKLVARTGGIAGTLSGQLIGEQQPTLLAQVAGTAGGLSSELNLRSIGVKTPERHGTHDVPEMVHSLLNIVLPDGRRASYRILQLAFSPAADVKVVATVAKESRLGFKLLEDAVARRLYPVLSRYIRLWWVHRAERKSAFALKAVIDQSALSIMILNRTSRLLFANARAMALLNAEDGLTVEGPTVVPIAAADRGPFAAAVTAGLDSNQKLRTAQNPHESPILQLARNGEKRALIVTALPVRASAVDSEDPAVIVYCLDPDEDVGDLLAPVCAIYKLTAVEARLVEKLISGKTLAEAAARINIRTQTARAYLKNIFIKTRTRRQADLVRVMLSSTFRTSTAKFSVPR